MDDDSKQQRCHTHDTHRYTEDDPKQTSCRRHRRGNSRTCLIQPLRAFASMRAEEDPHHQATEGHNCRRNVPRMRGIKVLRLVVDPFVFQSVLTVCPRGGGTVAVVVLLPLVLQLWQPIGNLFLPRCPFVEMVLGSQTFTVPVAFGRRAEVTAQCIFHGRDGHVPFPWLNMLAHAALVRIQLPTELRLQLRCYCVCVCLCVRG
jgi:hypothetical protein